jgi:hypothetical protein
MTEDDVFLAIERQSRARAESVRKLLRGEGRNDLVRDLDDKLREIESGVDGAKAVWHSISSAQRRVLELLAEGRRAVRAAWSRTQYNAPGTPHMVSPLCGLPTLRALSARDLVAPDGGAFDPERAFVLTDRARFVLAHGKPAA